MMRLASLASAALLLSACVAGPDRLPSAADVSLPPAFGFAVDPDSQASLADLLPSKDPAYAALVSAALADAPTLAAALARIDGARAQADRAGAERLPAIDGSLSAERSRSSTAQSGIPSIPGVDIDRTRSTFGANLTARWDADLFGGLRSRQRAASERVDAAGADAAAVRLALLSEIAASVIDWRSLAARERRLRDDLAAAERLAELARNRESAGLSPAIDRLRAEAEAAASRGSLTALDSDRARLIGRLVSLTARPAPDVVNWLAMPAPEQNLSPAPPALPSTLLTNRPDVLASAARLRAADADVAAAAAERFPKLTLSGALGLLALTVGGLFDSDALTGSLGADLAGPLLDFGRVAANIDRAEADTTEAFANYRDAVYTALGDAEGSYALIAAADREFAAAAAEASARDRAARLAEIRFNAGLSDLIAVLDTRRLAFAAAERSARAHGRSGRARVTLWQALGGDFVPPKAPGS